jgi:cytoskeletal protein CcmA (bactofilin family)
MWLNRQSQSTASSRHVAESSSAPKTANGGIRISTTAHVASWLSETMSVKGEISGNEDLLVDGKVEGPISLGQHQLTVGRTGHVTGGLTAREIIIHGKVDGGRSLESESIEISRDAVVVGDVTTRRILIEDGASFKGSIEIEDGSKQVDSNLDNALPTQTVSNSA